MFVGLLKHLMSRLESEQNPGVPCPQYSRRLTFWYSKQGFIQDFFLGGGNVCVRES